MSNLIDRNGISNIVSKIKSYIDLVKKSFEGWVLDPDPYENMEKFTVVVANCPTSKIRITFDGDVEYEGLWYKGHGNARTWILNPGVEVVVEALGEINWEGHYYELPETPIKKFISSAGGRHYIEMEYTQIPWDAGYEDTICTFNQSDEVGSITITRSGGDALYHILDGVMYFGVKRKGKRCVIAQLDDAYKGNESIEDRCYGWEQSWRFVDGTYMDKFSCNRQGWIMCGLRKFCWKVTEIRKNVFEVRFHYGTAPDGSWEEWDSNYLWSCRFARAIKRVSDDRWFVSMMWDKHDWLPNSGKLYESHTDINEAYYYTDYEQWMDQYAEECPGWNMMDWDARCVLHTMILGYRQTHADGVTNKQFICDGLYHVSSTGPKRHEYLPRKNNWVENYNLYILPRSGNSRIMHIAPGYGGVYGEVGFNRFLDMYPKTNGNKWNRSNYWILASYSFISDEASGGNLPLLSYDPSPDKRGTRGQFCGEVEVVDGAELVKLPFELGTWEDEIILAGYDPVEREANLAEINRTGWPSPGWGT